MHRLTRPLCRTILPCLLAILAAAPLPGQVPDVATREFSLENGLKVVLRQDKSVPRVNVVMAFHVGSRNERPGRTGFAHFFEHMMFRGTKNVPNYDKPLQEAGSSSNAFTTEDMTVYFETVPSNFLERAIYLEADRLAWLPTALDQQKFDTEREVVKNERRQSYENVPYGLAEETILANLYPAGHPYRWSVIGSMADLSRASLDDLRQFFAEFYHPANATFCLAGDFDPEAAEKLIRQYFSPIAPGPKPQKAAVPAVPKPGKSLELVDKVSVPRVYWVWPAVHENAPDASALELLGQILSSGDASRLHERLVIRDQSATSIALSFTGSEVDGYIQMQATVAPGRTVEEVEKAVAEELAKIRATAPSQRELDRMKAQYELSAFQPLEDPQSLAFALAIGSAQYGDSKQFRKDIERVLGVTAEQVHAAAGKYLTTEKLRLVVRPAKEGEEKTAAVTGIGPLPTGEAEAKLPFKEPAASVVDWSRMPGPTDRPAYNPPAYEKRKLSNGMELWFARRETPLVHLSLVMEGGTIDDPAGLEGTGQMTGRLMDKGTRGKTNRELTEAFELLGSTPSVSVGPDQSAIGLTLLPRNIKPALNLVQEMLTQPRFEAEEFDRQKSQMTAALKRGPDSPGYLASRAFSKLVFGSQSRFGHPSDGTMASLAKLTLEDSKKFFARITNPSASRLFVVGDMSVEEAVKLAVETLGGWKTAAEAGALTNARPAETTSADASTVYLVDKPGAVQSVIRLGRRWKPRTDKTTYLPGQVGNYTLGGDFLSRLNQNLRERNGYSYGAGSTFAYIRGGDRWAVSTSVRADVTGAALREIFNELDGVSKAGKQPLTDADLSLARDALVQSFPEGFGTPDGLLSAMQDLAEFGLERSEWLTYIVQVSKVTDADVKAVMADLVDSANRVVVIAGDRKSVEPQLKKAGFEKIVIIPLADLTDAVGSSAGVGQVKPEEK
jgi:zinc protease